MSSARSHDVPANGVAAAAKGALLSVNAETTFKSPSAAFGVNIVSKRRPAQIDRFGQHHSDRVAQSAQLFRREATQGRFRVNSRTEERFIDINVTESRQNGLVQQNGLRHAGPGPEDTIEIVGR